MNIYQISQSVNLNAGTYDSAIVIAKTLHAARNLNPAGLWGNCSWAENSTQVEVRLLGVARPGFSQSVISISLNVR